MAHLRILLSATRHLAHFTRCRLDYSKRISSAFDIVRNNHWNTNWNTNLVCAKFISMGLRQVHKQAHLLMIASKWAIVLTSGWRLIGRCIQRGRCARNLMHNWIRSKIVFIWELFKCQYLQFIDDERYIFKWHTFSRKRDFVRWPFCRVVWMPLIQSALFLKII